MVDHVDKKELAGAARKVGIEISPVPLQALFDGTLACIAAQVGANLGST